MDTETERCEDCGADWITDDVQIVYDEDGRCLCTDCFFERQCMEDYDGS